MSIDVLQFGTLSTIRAKLNRRELSSVDLTRAVLDRLQRIGRRYNAVAHILADRALHEARAADHRLRNGANAPLLGIPYGAKDLLAAKGAPTTWGAAPYARQRFKYDATVIAKLRGAGAVLAAKLTMVELAGGGMASLHGPGRNPWNSDHWSGGSSSGTAIAVAARITPFGIGSETAGSIIVPSAYCGVTGLRPTYGLVSRYGAMALSWTLDKIGPICRTAEDCGLVLEVIAGPDSRDPSSARRNFRLDGMRKPSGLRVGYVADAFEDGPHLSNQAARDALVVLRTLGARLKRIALPALPADPMVRIVIGSEGSATFREMIERGRVDDLADRKLQAEFRAGLRISAVTYITAMRLRRMLQDAFAKAFAIVDVIVAPSTKAPAPRLRESLYPAPHRSASRAGHQPPHCPISEPQYDATPLVCAGNLAGLPALGLPCGFGAGGLPVGLQLVGRPFEEGTLVTLGHAYQRATDWHTRIPPTTTI